MKQTTESNGNAPTAHHRHTALPVASTTKPVGLRRSAGFSLSTFPSPVGLYAGPSRRNVANPWREKHSFACGKLADGLDEAYLGSKESCRAKSDSNHGYLNLSQKFRAIFFLPRASNSKATQDTASKALKHTRNSL